MGTFHEDLHLFLSLEVIEWGIPSQACNHIGKFPMMTSSARQALDTLPMQLLTPDSSDISFIICKHQRSNSGELAKIVMLCVHFITSCL
jgi:hypothetical protein